MSRPSDTDATTPRAAILIVCVGNEHRGDDAFGIAVANRLGGMPAGAKLIVNRGDALALVDAWRGFNHVIFVDTAVADSAPGTIFEFDVSGTPAPIEMGGTSTHALGPGGVIELARAIGALPERVHVIAVAGREFAVGAAMTSAVAGRVDTIVNRIRTMIDSQACD